MHAVIRADIMSDWDRSDLWASTCCAWFSIADVLYTAGEAIPEDWHYHNPHTPEHVLSTIYDENNGDWLAADLRESYYTNLVTADDLRHAGNVLARLYSILKAQGRDY